VGTGGALVADLDGSIPQTTCAGVY
jgi:hypothetical protein